MERKQSGQPQTEEDIYRKISDMAEEQRDELIQLRRDFHRYPETSWLEMRTSAKIAEYLTELGMEVLTGKDVCREEARIGVPDSDILERHFSQVKEQGAPARFLTEELEQGYTGVVGILRCGEGPTVALRFDIDALPMEEAEDLEHRPFREGFSSQNPGMMHACGHDCHAAIGLGTARILSELRDQLHGTVKFCSSLGRKGQRALTPWWKMAIWMESTILPELMWRRTTRRTTGILPQEPTVHWLPVSITSSSTVRQLMQEVFRKKGKMPFWPQLMLQ